MKLRAALVASAVLAGTVLAGTGSAATPCNLLVDPKGDATQVFLPETEGLGPNVPSLDIIGADWASDGKKITGVIRVDKLNKSDTNAPTGMTWYLYATIGETEIFMTAETSPDGGDAFNAGYVDPVTARTSLGAIAGVFDTARNEIRMTAPVAVFAAQAKIASGTKLTAVNALGQRIAVIVTPTADLAETTGVYTVGNKNCVVVGA